jgi:hypothetical protein
MTALRLVQYRLNKLANVYESKHGNVGFELTAVAMKNAVLWDVAPCEFIIRSIVCIPLKCKCFRNTSHTVTFEIPLQSPFCKLQTPSTAELHCPTLNTATGSINEVFSASVA